MIYTMDRKYRTKLENPNYVNVHNLVKNQSNINYIILDSMFKKKNLPELLKYYPEFSKNAVHVNNTIYDYTYTLHSLYIKCKVKNNYCDLEKKYKKPLCDLHNLFRFEREKGNKKFKITYNIVCDMLRTYDPAYIYSILF
jgi:hypothetical protein